MMNEPSASRPGRGHLFEVVALIILFASITAFTVIGFVVRDWPPPVASEHGVGVDSVMAYLTLATGAVLLIGTIVFLAFLWKYGRGRPAGSPVTTARTERRWTAVPILGMALLAEAGVLVKGLPVWEQVYGEIPDDALVVEITAQQFEWITRYPGPDGEFGRLALDAIDQSANPAGLDRGDGASEDDIVVRNTLHVPVDRPIVVRLRARDVLHSFSVPAFRVKQDIVPGMVGTTRFTATATGTYEIACAELCGMGHYQMSGRVIVHTADDFAAWLADQTGQ